jgi:hypothetical protein
MPVARYFLFVGGALLALLLAIDALFPQQALVASRGASSVDKTVVRIRSDQKPPERVVYDTSLPTIVPPPAVTAQVVMAPVVAPAAAAVSADASAEARARETFAQFVPAEAKKPEPQIQRKRKVAKTRPAPPMQIAQQPQMRVAQQSQFGFFGGSNWNSTW